MMLSNEAASVGATDLCELATATRVDVSVVEMARVEQREERTEEA
jgi:hypothetical protein